MSPHNTPPSPSLLSPLLLLLLLLIPFSILPLASARPSLRQEADLCPGVVDCLVPNVEPLVSLEQRESGHATGTLNLSACISFCQDTKHKYYHFLAGPPGKKGPCACFNGCAFLRPGDATVGLVDLCRASPLLQLKAQKLQEIEEWAEDSDAETAYLSGDGFQKQKQNGGLMTQGQMFLKQAKEEEQLAMELALRQKLVEKASQAPKELLKLQQNKQLASQKAVGWRMLQQYQVLLTTIQHRFLEKQQEELKVQKEQREEEKLLRKERLSTENRSKHMKKQEQEKQLRSVMAMFKNLVKEPIQGKV